MPVDAALRFGFVDLAGHGSPRGGVQYNVVDAADASVGALPVGPGCGPDDKGFAITVQVHTLWIDDLPDLGRINEGVLKLTGRTRQLEAPAQKHDVSTSLDFTARDGTVGGVSFELGFSGLLVKNRLVLGIEIVELDKDAKIYYEKVKKAVDPAVGKELLDLAKGVPYLELATKLADGLIAAFGTNAHDRVWSATPMFAVRPLIGAPYLRSGMYVAYEDTSQTLPPHELGYSDGAIVVAGTSTPIGRNSLVFLIGLERPSEKTRQKLALV